MLFRPVNEASSASDALTRKQRAPRSLGSCQPTVEPLEQRRQLRRGHPHHAIPHLRPDELAAFEALVNQHNPGLIPDQKLDAVRPLRAEHEDRPAEQVELEHLLHRQREAVDPCAEVHWARRHLDLYRSSLTEDHDAAARPARVSRTSSALAPTRIKTSLTTICTPVVTSVSVCTSDAAASTTSVANIGSAATCLGTANWPARTFFGSRRPASASSRADVQHPSTKPAEPGSPPLSAPSAPSRPLDHPQPRKPRRSRSRPNGRSLCRLVPSPNLQRPCARRMAPVAGEGQRRAYLTTRAVSFEKGAIRHQRIWCRQQIPLLCRSPSGGISLAIYTQLRGWHTQGRHRRQRRWSHGNQRRHSRQVLRAVHRSA